MEYSASSVKYLLWFVEMRETIRLLQDHSMEEVRQIVLDENTYQQKARDRIVNEFGCIKKRIDALPTELTMFMLKTDINTAKLIALVGAMAADSLFFELMYEVFREKLRLGEEDFKDSDLNIFFSVKEMQSQIVAGWTEATRKKLKSTYTKFLIEAGLLREVGYRDRKVVRPYIDQDLREILLRNHMEKYLFTLTGEQ